MLVSLQTAAGTTLYQVTQKGNCLLAAGYWFGYMYALWVAERGRRGKGGGCHKGQQAGVEGEKEGWNATRSELTQIKHCTALLLEDAFNGCVEELFVHHPEGQLVIHILPFLFGFVVGERIHDAPFDVGMVAATILVDKVVVFKVIVILGQFICVGSRNPRANGRSIGTRAKMLGQTRGSACGCCIRWRKVVKSADGWEGDDGRGRCGSRRWR